jgi:hypothetical protein
LEIVNAKEEDGYDRGLSALLAAGPTEDADAGTLAVQNGIWGGGA